MINNFNVIDNFLQFEEGTFYKFELLVRNTDGHNDLYQEGYSKTNKNIVIKSWYVDNKDYYEKIKHEMITMANLTGARIYITLDRKDNVKLVQGVLHSFTDSICAMLKGQKPAIKNLSRTFASETSKEINSSSKFRTIMFDIDTRDESIKNIIVNYIEMEHVNKAKEVCPRVKAHVLETKKGYHIFCYRKFDYSDWFNYCLEKYLKSKYGDGIHKDKIKELADFFKKSVSVKSNELGLVYHPMKNLNFIIDWQTKDQPEDAYLHKKEFKSLDEARIFMKQLKEDKNVCYIYTNKIQIEDLTKCEIIGDIE